MRLSFLFSMALILFCAFAFAQQGPPPGEFGHPPGRGPEDGPGGKWGGPGGEFIAEVMMARMSKELKLTDEQTVLMVRRFSELRDQTRELRKQRGELIRKLDTHLRSEAPNGEQAKALVAELTALDEKLTHERQTVFEAMGADLDDVQRAKLYLFLDRFEADMRRMAGEARERFRGPRGEGGPRGGDGNQRGEGGPRGEGPPHQGPRGPHPEGPPPPPGEF